MSIASENCEIFKRNLRKLIEAAGGHVHGMSMAEILHEAASEIGWDKELRWHHSGDGIIAAFDLNVDQDGHVTVEQEAGEPK
jgi:hypothetical protein